MVAPYVLVVVVWAKSVIGDEAKKVMDKRLRALTRRVLLDNEPEKSSPPPSPASTNPDELRKAVASYAVTLGLSAERASLLADAVVGRMLPGVER